MATDRNLQIEIDMVACMRDLLGPGFVDAYYRNMASEFIQVAEAHLRDSFKDGVNSKLSTEPISFDKWISAAVQKPTPFQRVLVCDSNETRLNLRGFPDNVRTGYWYSFVLDETKYEGWECPIRPTHWTLLPASASWNQ